LEEKRKDVGIFGEEGIAEIEIGNGKMRFGLFKGVVEKNENRMLM